MSKKKAASKKPEQVEVKDEFIPEEELIQDVAKPIVVASKPKRQTYQEIMTDRAKQQKEIMLKNIERNKAVQAAMAKRKAK